MNDSTTNKNRKVIISVSIIIAVVVICSQITLFSIPPIGAVPEGRTLLILRRQNTNFIDSADAFCQREAGGVSLLCRATILGAIATDGVILRLPYMGFLHNISTN